MKHTILAIVVLMMMSVSLAQETVTTIATANVRTCAQTSCGVVERLFRGSTLTITGEATGTRFRGSTLWYAVRLEDGREGYVHSTLVDAPAQTVTAPTTNTRLSGGSSAAPATQSPAPAAAGSSCGGARTCGQMNSCEQAYACLREGNGGLDRDNDGVPCESICPEG